MGAVKDIRSWNDEIEIGLKSTDKLGFRGSTALVATTWTTSNVTTDRSIDANAAVAVIGDGLTTLIEDLKDIGLLT